MGGRSPLRLAHLTTVDMSLAWLLSTELQVDVDAGFETIGISAPGPFVPQIEAQGVRHVAVPELTRAWDPRRDGAAARALWRTLRDLDLDILHTHNPKTGVLGRVLGRVAGVPVVVNTCHGLWAQPADRLPRRAFVYGLEALAARFSHYELYQNDADRRTLQPWVPQSSVRTVGNGVDLRRFRRSAHLRRQVRDELGVGEDEVLVGGVGRRVVEKGLGEFLATADALHHIARFVWVGPPDHDTAVPFLQESAAVTFLGERHDMPAIYSALDIFVLPSYREGFSRSGMEAAACGCALVLSDIRGCRELGLDGEELVLVPPRTAEPLRQAVQDLIENPDRRARLAAAASKRAHARFDQRAVARASLEAYRDVAARKGLSWTGRLTDALEAA